MSTGAIPDNEAAIMRAVSSALGHPPPFALEECSNFDGRLAISDAHDLESLDKFPSVTSLQVFGSDLAALDALSGMQSLKSLRIIACPVVDLAPIRNLSSLEEVEVSFTFVQDASSILELPALHRLRLLGNPLSFANYDQTNAVLRRSAAAHGRRMVMHLTRPSEWAAGVLLHGRGIGLCFSSVDGWVPTLVCPGTKWRLSRYSSIGEIESILQRSKVTTGSILELPGDQADFVSAESSLVSDRSLGDSYDAEDWIRRSDLELEDRSVLQRLIDGFDGLVFFRDGEQTISLKERSWKANLPNWYRRMRKVLGFVCSGERVTAYFFGRDEVDYRIEPVGYDDTESAPVLRRLGLFPVAIATDRSRTLAISTDDRDRRIYEFTEAWLGQEGHPLSSPWEAYPSYAAMLAEIVAIRRGDGTVIARKSTQSISPTPGYPNEG